MSIILISLLAIVAMASEAGAVVAPSVPSYSSILQSLQSLAAATNVKAATTTTIKATTKASAPQWTAQCDKEASALTTAVLKNKALAQAMLNYFELPQLSQYLLGKTNVLPAFPTSIVPAYIDANCVQAGLTKVTYAQLQQYLPTAVNYVNAMKI